MQSPQLRRAGIALYTTALRAVAFLPPPRVLLNGPGKSGTHLLSDCVALLPRMTFSGRHFGVTSNGHGRRPAQSFNLPSQRDRLERFLRRCPNGMFLTAHAAFDPWLAETLDDLNMRHVLLLRDPRDVVVSRAFFRTRLSWHPHHRYYTEVLVDDDERILTTIRGFPPNPVSPVPLLSVGALYRSFMRWLDVPGVLQVNFENLVGPTGGGQRETQLETVKRIADFVGRPIDDHLAAFVANNMYSRKGLTYRKGIAGDWRNHFNDAHREAFDEVAGDILIELGYEDSRDW